MPCAVPGRWLLTALQATAGGNLTFLRDNVLYHHDELLTEERLPDVFKIFDRMAERVPPGSNGVIYTPWIYGERAPVDDRALRAGLYNLSLDNTREDIVRAFLEGVALNTRWLMKPVEKFLGRPVKASTWRAAAASRRSGARSSPTPSGSRCARCATRSRPTPGAPPGSRPSAWARSRSPTCPAW